jgi:hypothetical protein
MNPEDINITANDPPMDGLPDPVPEQTIDDYDIF